MSVGVNDFGVPVGEAMRFGTYDNATDVYTESGNFNSNGKLSFEAPVGTWTVECHDDSDEGVSVESPTTGSGNYVQMGNMVWINFNISNIDVTGMSGVKNMFFKGHGFTPMEQTVLGPVVLNDFNLAASRFSVVAEITSDGDIVLREMGDAVENITANVSQFSGTDVRVSGWFRTS